MEMSLYVPFKDVNVVSYLYKECYTIFCRKNVRVGVCKDSSRVLAYKAQMEAWQALCQLLAEVEDEMSAPGST